MLTLNSVTNEIVCAQGDTGMLRVLIKDADGNPLPRPIVGVAIFAVCQKVRTEYNTITSKVFAIVNNVTVVNITNRLSRLIPPGQYQWDIRVVTDPDYDDEDNVIAGDDTDEVHSCFAGTPGGMPKYTVPGVAVNV